MAIGARQFNILQQFLIEAVLICLIGGVTGILLSGLIGLLFNVFMTDFTMAFSTGSIVAAVVFSTLIGVIFGYMPAKRAAQLDPITACLLYTSLFSKNLPDFGWLPNTCAYRLLYEEKPLPEWHPLVSGDPDSVKKAGVLIQDGVHEEDVIDWFEFVIETE